MKCLCAAVSGWEALYYRVECIPDVRYDDGALGDEVPVVHVILLDAVRYAKWGRRAPSDDLLEHCREVWEVIAILERWQAVVADDGVELRLAFALHLRVCSHSKEEG